MKKFFIIAVTNLIVSYTYSQSYLPLAAGPGSPLSGSLFTTSAQSNSIAGAINLQDGFGYWLQRTGTDGSFNIDGYNSGQAYQNNFKLTRDGTLNISGSLSATSAMMGVAQLGTWSNNVSFARVGYINPTGTDVLNYGFLQQSNGNVYLKGPQIYFESPTNFSGILTGTSAMFSGNIGVGTSTPYKLQVQADGSNPGALEIVSAFRKSSPGGGELALRVHDGLVDILSTYEASPANMDMSFSTTRSDGYQPERMRIQASTGYVGIGTATPDSKLTVAGKIHSQEVKVSISAGADFVFEPEYKLKSLAETEKYIQANKHLPEVASADEMKTKGVELGEMNIKLLQKIEELTLHIIELNKRIEKLEKPASWN